VSRSRIDGWSGLEETYLFTALNLSRSSGSQHALFDQVS
jgi:hypothetical protein